MPDGGPLSLPARDALAAAGKRALGRRFASLTPRLGSRPCGPVSPSSAARRPDTLSLVLAAERTSEIPTPRRGSRRADRVAAKTRGSRVTTSSARRRAGRNAAQRRNTHQEKPRAYGRVAKAPTITTYVHDALGNLRGVGLPDGTVVEYLVDGEGRRVGKKVDGVLERGWLWSGKLRPVAELDGSGAVV